MLPYAVTLFLSAFLLFGVQPLAGKYSLPWFGGTPAVWTTCMLFFQIMLLAGYCYSYVSSRFLRPRRQAQVHLALLAFTLVVLAARALLSGSPLAPGPEWRPTDGISSARLLAMLAVTLGLPFFTLSTSAPLLQSWFSQTHPGVSPYRLYSLSNAGSLLALLAYPFLVEPWLGRGVQTWAWAAGFLLFIGGCLVCARHVLRLADAPAQAHQPQDTPDAAPPSLGRTLAWLGLSGSASVLLLATTNQLSQDVSAGPFVWVLPLALYLLTFIIAFEREALYSRSFTALLLLLSVGMVTTLRYQGGKAPLIAQVLGHSLALFSGALLCNGELYRLRPSPRHLGAFYLWGSVGGALGGLIVHLVAPRVLRSYLEYPLALGACCLLAALLLLRNPPEGKRLQLVLRVTTALFLLLVVGGLGQSVAVTRNMRDSSRNFFGVVQVWEADLNSDMHSYVLRHGVIMHGYQYIAPERRNVPTTYYTPEGGLGLALAEKRRLKELSGQPPSLRVGVLGLGIGTSAALGQAGDSFRFYEINPDVIALAQGAGGYYSFLKDSPAGVEVLEGDARILLEQELERGQEQNFDLLAVDVFSSDAIPVHLLTEEAMAVYKRHLAPGGVLALHISNLHLDLLPIVLTHAQTLGLHTTEVRSIPKDGDEHTSESHWALLSSERGFSQGAAFASAREQVRSVALRDPPRVRWTDERNSILQVLRDVRWNHQKVIAEPAEPTPAVAAPAGP